MRIGDGHAAVIGDELAEATVPQNGTGRGKGLSPEGEGADQEFVEKVIFPGALKNAQMQGARNPEE